MQNTPQLPPQPISTDVLLEKYCKNGETTADEIFKRVAKALASVEKPELQAHWEEKFLENMRAGAIGAGRIMSAAGTDIQATYINCFLQGVGDSIKGHSEDGYPGIYTALEEAAETMRRGGGVGYDFSRIRPKGAQVKGTQSLASGPCSYINVFDQSGLTVESAGFRRSAQMGVLRIDHPDVREFITAKREKGRWNNFNVSVGVSDAFMIAVETGDKWELVHKAEPGEEIKAKGAYQREDGLWVYEVVQAQDLWNTIMQSAYDFAEPGILFLDKINSDNNLRYTETIEATNPCGEQVLPKYGCCDLGQVILPKYVHNPFSVDATFDFPSFQKSVGTLVRFLDNVLTATPWPLEQQQRESESKRRIGIGFTGLGNTLAMMQLRYDSPEGRDMAEHITIAMRDAAYAASVELAKEKGAFPLFNAKEYLAEGTFASRLPAGLKAAIKKHGIRNSHLLSIAPTGCVVPETRIITEKGLVEIASLENGSQDEWQEIGVSVSTDQGYKNATKFFNNGYKDVYKVTDDHGYSVSSTGNHQLRVLTRDNGYEWKRVDELEEGDVLVRMLNTYPEDVTPAVPVYNDEFNVDRRAVPLQRMERFTPEMAEMVGFLMSNGNVKTDRHVRFFHHKDHHIPMFAKLVNTFAHQFGLRNCKWHTFGEDNPHRRNLAELHVHSKELVQWLELNDARKDRGSNLHIPHWVFTGGREIIYAFVRGLFEGDGTSGPTSVAYSSIDKEFIEELQVLLASVGVVSRINYSRRGKTENSFGSNPVYRLLIGNYIDRERFAEHIGFLSNKGDRLLQGLALNKGRGQERRLLQREAALTYKHLTRNVRCKQEFQAHLDALGVTEELHYSTVASVEHVGVRHTVDISVPDNVTYCANSFVSHNTVSLAFADNASNGIEPAFSWTYTRKKRMADGTHYFYDVEDHAYRLYKEMFGKDAELPDYFVTALEMGVDGHVDMMVAVQRHIDASASKTSNVPADYPYEDFKGLYHKAWKGGLKGMATYRPNDTLGSVLSVTPEPVKAPVKEPVKEPTIDPHKVVIENRPQGALNAVTEKIEYWTTEGRKRMYLIVSFLPIEGTERAIEFFMPVGQGDNQQWIAATLRTLALAARGGFLEKALEDLRKVTWDRGPVRLGFYEKADGTKVPRFHDSEVAAVAYALQEIISKRASTHSAIHSSIHEEASPSVEAPKAPIHDAPANVVQAGKKCNECGAHAVIRKDGCDYCTSCGALGSCG